MLCTSRVLGNAEFQQAGHMHLTGKNAAQTDLHRENQEEMEP